MNKNNKNSAPSPSRPSLSFYKIHVFNNGNIHRRTIFRKIQTVLGRVNIFVWTRVRSQEFDFYVKGRVISHAIEKLTCFGNDVTFKASFKPLSPPIARLSSDSASELRVQLSVELSSRFQNGHLDLSNFEDNNPFKSMYYIPLSNSIVQQTINGMIKGNKKMDSQIVSVDLSGNQLTSLVNFDFLVKGNNIKSLKLNDNDIRSIETIFNPVKSMPLTDLVINNNPFIKSSVDGGRNYVDYIHEIFPSLLTLDNEPLGQMKKKFDPSSSTNKAKPSSSTNKTQPATKKRSRSDASGSQDVIKMTVTAKKIKTEEQQPQTEQNLTDGIESSDNGRSSSRSKMMEDLIIGQPQQQQQQCHHHPEENNNIGLPNHDTCEDKFIKLQNQLNMALNKIDELTKHQQQQEKDLQEVHNDNHWLNIEMERLKYSITPQNDSVMNGTSTSTFIQPSQTTNNLGEDMLSSASTSSLEDISHLFDRPRR